MKSIKLLVIAISIAACSKGGTTGVTKDSVKEFRDSIRGQVMTLDEATKKGTDKFGPPTHKDDKKAVWAGKEDGEHCFEFYFEAMSGTTANGTESVDCPK